MFFSLTKLNHAAVSRSRKVLVKSFVYFAIATIANCQDFAALIDSERIPLSASENMLEAQIIWVR